MGGDINFDWGFKKNYGMGAPPLWETLGSVKIRLACSRVLLLIISSSNIITHSNGFMVIYIYKVEQTEYRKITFITISNT